MGRIACAATWFILLTVMGPVGCGEGSAGSADADADTDRTELEELARELQGQLHHPERFDPLAPEAFIAQLQDAAEARPLTVEERLDLGLAHFLLEQWTEAAAVFADLAAATDDPAVRGQALYYQGRTLAMKAATEPSHWREAAQLVNEANRLLPENPMIAAERYWLWTQAGDELEAEVAHSRLQQMNMELEGVEVFDPTTVVVVAVITAGVITLYAIHKDKLEREDIIRIVRGMLLIAGGARAAHLAVS